MELSKSQSRELMRYVLRRLGPDASDAAVISFAHHIGAQDGIVDADGDLTTRVRDHFDAALIKAREAGLLPAEQEQEEPAPAPAVALPAVSLTKTDIAEAVREGMKPEQVGGERGEFLTWMKHKYPGLTVTEFEAFRLEAQRTMHAEWEHDIEAQRRATSLGFGKRSKITALPGYVSQMDAKKQLEFINLTELAASGLADSEAFVRAGFEAPADFTPKIGGSSGKGFK